MPLPLLKSYAQKSGQSIEKVEALWAEAKKEAENQGRGSRGQPAVKDKRYWMLVNASLKRKLNLSEHTGFAEHVLIDALVDHREISDGTDQEATHEG